MSPKETPAPSAEQGLAEDKPVGGTHDGLPRRRTRRVVVLALGAAVLIAALTIFLVSRTMSQDQPEPVAVTVPVGLSHIDAPKDLKLGVVATLGDTRSEGSEWASAAEGARVAQYRLATGGSEVELVFEDDRGSEAGSVEAVELLREQGVSGIVFATSGAHLAAGIENAAQANIPVVLPYAHIPEGAEFPSAWSLASDSRAMNAALNEAISGYEFPVLLDAGPGVSDALEVDETLEIGDSDLSTLAAEAARRTGANADSHGAYTGADDEEAEQVEDDDTSPNADALVVSGSPRTVATLVTELQSRSVSVPLILAPSATSPGFAQVLSEQGGSVSTSLETVGANLGDAVALGNDEPARAMSAYLQAVRQLADDPDALTLTGDAPFAEVSAWADVRSHDAVLALAAAAEAGGRTEPEQVVEGFADLQLGAADGVAGARLDFTQSPAASAEVVSLHATAQPLGLRPAGQVPVSWFPEPPSEE